MNMKTTPPDIYLKSVSKGFASRVSVLQDANLTISSGSVIIITGFNEAGKTTLLNLIAGIEPPTSGTILIGSQSFWSLSSVARARHYNQTFGFITQNPGIIRTLPVEQNIALPLLFNTSLHEEEREQQLEKAIQRFDLKDLQHKQLAEISGGAAQRVNIARALINDPQIILADEPFRNLDANHMQNIMRIFKEEHSRGKTFILTRQAQDEVWRDLFASNTVRHVVIRKGQAPEILSTAELDRLSHETLNRTMKDSNQRGVPLSSTEAQKMLQEIEEVLYYIQSKRHNLAVELHEDITHFSEKIRELVDRQKNLPPDERSRVDTKLQELRGKFNTLRNIQKDLDRQ